MTNLLTETLTAIGGSGHRIADVIFIGSTDGKVAYECSWDQFTELADFEYDSGFGAARVATDLRVVFSDGSDMHRGEYDGSEWWEFSAPFVKPETTMPIKTLGGNDHLWDSLADMHEAK